MRNLAHFGNITFLVFIFLKPRDSFLKQSGINIDYHRFLKQLNNSESVYFDPKFPEMEYQTLHEIDYLTDLKFGRFHQFLNLFNEKGKNSEELFEIRRAIGAVVKFLMKDTIITISESIITNETISFLRLRRYWQVFYYCITTYNFMENVNPCTSGFQISNVHGFLPWNPDKDLQLLPLGHKMLIILYNLAMCLNFYEQVPFLCPYLCVGRNVVEGVIKTVPGNPCEDVPKRRNNLCRQTRNWVDTIYNLFEKLADPEDWVNNPKSDVSLGWIASESGYVCNCSAGYEWIHTRMDCVRKGSRRDKCSSVLNGCHQQNTLTCLSSSGMDGYRCICKEGYTGTKCTHQIDACEMNILRYTHLDPNAKSRQMKLTNGNQLCNVNVSGMKTSSNGTSKCIPFKGTNQYRCECQGPFVEDSHINLPNCMKLIGACDRKLCIHGSCITAQHSSEVAVCVCNLGFDGPSCTHKVSCEK
ncbi:unnamed protein product [Heterobilharzia americana]|nr:unnamed protein product [Heterobilharzia americana]CAH8526535.1 unnamed protein product [Heterobilharzia americana]